MRKNSNKELEKKIIEIGALIPDNANANRGTLIGKELLAKSFKLYGAGRSILIDKNDRIVAGNKSQDAAKNSGVKDVIVVETDGNELIAVRRTDLDLDTQEGRGLAAMDNTTSVRNLEWDETALQYISAKWGVNTRNWGVATKEFEEGFQPNLNPGQQNSVISDSDIQRAQDKIEDKIQHHKNSKDVRRVICPNCGLEFDIQKFE